MDHLYAAGVSIIEFTQDWFQDYEGFFETVNDLSNPHNVSEVLFPVISTFDSVFASQLLLCLSFGGWLNTILKWWFMEDRPYWWVQETSYYSSQRPHLQQFRQTCETGPGYPSGHTATAATLLVLAVMWISHIMHDRKLNMWWWKYIVYPLFGGALAAVMLARMFVATHFPHQCLIGALVGAFVAPGLCIFVSDPYIWQVGPQGRVPARAVLVAVAAAVSALTYLYLVLFGWDPNWTVKLAFRWCENPDDIHVSTTPLFALIQSSASLLGWALCLTPAVAKYRYNTKYRSISLSATATLTLLYSLKLIQDKIGKENALCFYGVHFVLATVKPMLLLRVTPFIAKLPFFAIKDNVE